MINGTAKDALDYEDRKSSGLKVIAIGGDKLARGLTLEGLCVSYFLRASRMYDTLMQMGRWFGYRPGYLDLTRLYTTQELIDWFTHITEAGEELREEFDLMAASGSTPREYGLKVQSHSTLMVTSHVKMRNARTLLLSFSGQVLETISLRRDAVSLDKNKKAAENLIAKLPLPEKDPERHRGNKTQNWTGYLWDTVSGDKVVEFLTAYRTHSAALKVNSLVLADFVRSMMLEGELTSWTVALIGGGEGKGEPFEPAPGISVDMLKRSKDTDHSDRYSIGRLLSPRDESIDLDTASWNAALDLATKAWHADPGRRKAKEEPDEPNGAAIRYIRGFGAHGIPAHPERGLLLLYALDPAEANAGFPPETPAIITFGISFPGSRSGTKVRYEVNNVLWDQDYEPAN
jgi:hypothetical protein